MKFILTIDTEADNQWDHGRMLTVENIKYVPRFQGLCDQYSIKPTYLVTSEVCEDPFARELFSEYLRSEKAEIGAHLHSWTTPPFLERDGYRHNDPDHLFASEMPSEIIGEKVRNLTAQIEASFGIRPSSFRSGRFGFNHDLAKVLADNQYLVDTSVTPYIDWTGFGGASGGPGGPDFMDATPFPSSFTFGDNTLLEIPVTILPTRYPLNSFPVLASKYFRNVDRNILLKLFRRTIFRNQPLWLRPHKWMNIKLFKELLDEAKRINLPFLVMMFHSSELMPGCSIYRKDEASIESLYGLMENFFELLSSGNIKPLTLTEAAKNVRV